MVLHIAQESVHTNSDPDYCVFYIQSGLLRDFRNPLLEFEDYLVGRREREWRDYVRDPSIAMTVADVSVFGKTLVVHFRYSNS